MRILRAVVLSLVAVLSVSSSASAQADSPRQTLVSANPIGLLFEWYNGEVEYAFAPTASVAVAGSRFDFWDSDTYTAVDLIGRFYPGGRAIRGFSIGLSAGFINVEGRCHDCTFNSPPSVDSETVGALGVRGDYVWVMGRDQRFSVAAGVGAKRLFGNDIGNAGLPIGRLSVGVAF